MRKLIIRYVNGSHIIWLCSTSSNTQVIRYYSPQSRGTAGTLIFWLQVPGVTLYWQLIFLAGTSLQMTGGHYLFRLYALVICDHCHPAPPQGNVEDFYFVSAIPHKHHTVGTASWQTMAVLPCSLLLYCTAMVAYVYQTPTFPPHYGDNVEVESQHICQTMSALLRGLSVSVVTNGWCIIYSLWCTTHKNLVF